MDKNFQAFAAYISSIKTKIRIYLAKKTWICLFLVEKVSILVKDLDFVNVFLKVST